MSHYEPYASRASFTRSVPVSHRALSIYGGAGGEGTRISSASSYGSLRSAPLGSSISSSSAFKVSSAGSGSLRAAGASAGHVLGDEKGQMQNLNDRLASYLETVRRLEKENSILEQKIREAMEKAGPDMRDYSKYQAIIDDLRKKIFDSTVDNARLVLQIDNARLATDDFRVKFENELSIRQSVEADIAGLKKLIDDTNIGRINVESEIEALREELLFLNKNHDNEVADLRNQIAQSGVQVDIDAPKGQDLSQVMEEMRENYEKQALKNAEELKIWHENQISEVQVQVTQNTEALQGAQMEMNDLRRQIQTLEIELASQQSLKASLEDTLRNTELRTNMEMEKNNTIILQLEAELAQLRAKITEQGQEYEALLNMKMKLEAEIATYKTLLDGGDLKLQDALE
ncbi:keratin, type I cytoskeletal 18b [Astyanax mexicanus]|uniref:Keratin, type I cytoskeletal 18-like n=1 Tax=Astyanax mexicanus TaxID=7994 RepID=A0A8B9K7V2_ASTMX|nr:keratin, type I cytoskeletal 18b [Astyanax mexicanus]KAG9277202.1 keratin, type I cytoskeletal 18-like [Astyanax mexicanus]